MSSDSLKCAECKKPAELKCSGCKMVAYCSKDHQKKHWKSHKSVCRPFEIKSTPEMGKFMAATRDLKPGDLILSEYPLVFGPKPQMIEEGPVPCPGCCRLVVPELAARCSGCGWPICDPNCAGLKDSNKHEHECLILCLRRSFAYNNMHEFYRHDALLALRCLMLQKKGLKKWQQFLEMESHVDKRGPDTEIHKILEDRVVSWITENYVIPIHAVEKESNAIVFPDKSKETLHKICGIIDVNSLEINQNETELSALYPTAYLMSHSCISNTRHTFATEDENYKITVRAALPIKKGEPVTTTYTHVLWGTQARREHLRDTKYFNCKCQRCKDPTELGSYMSALRCLGTAELGACGGIQLPINPLDDDTEWACDSCPVRLSNRQIAGLINQIGDEVDSIQLGNPTVRELNNILDKMTTFLHQRHYHMYAVKHSLIQLYGYQQGYLPNQISDESLKSKANMCRELLDVTKRIDPGNARLCLYSGVILHELHLANIYLVKRKWDVAIGNKENLKNLLEEGQKVLLEAKEVLKNEATSSAGQKLLGLIDDSTRDLERYIARNKITFTKNATTGKVV